MDLNLIEQITSSGLYSTITDEPYFSWQGCDYCHARTGKRLGNTVYDVKGYATLDDAQNNPGNYYEFRLCGGCLCAIDNGDPWSEEGAL